MGPRNVDGLRKKIVSEFDGLSNRLQQVAKYVLDHPNDMALETLAVISERIGVQPSTIVRFAKAMGYEGASPMQRLFRAELLAGEHSLGYRERIRKFREASDSSVEATAEVLLNELVDASVAAMEHLRETVSYDQLNKSASLLAEADRVFVAGFGRSFAVASYISYALHRLNKPSTFIDGLGGLSEQQIAQSGKEDVLIAIGFHPYSREIRNVVAAAEQRNTRVIGITDSQVSPVTTNAAIALVVTDAVVHDFRSLSATLALAQSMILSFACQTTDS